MFDFNLKANVSAPRYEARKVKSSEKLAIHKRR